MEIEDAIYIKMCDCPEIQANHDFIKGDYIYAVGENSISFHERARLGIIIGEDEDEFFGEKALVAVEIDGKKSFTFDNVSFSRAPYDENNIPNSGAWIKRRVWLPLQEDLQEMVPKEYENEGFEWKLRRFKVWHSEEIWGTGHSFTSIKQLWLAFLMKELVEKFWSGEKWLKRLEQVT